MSRRHSPSAGVSYGVRRVCQVWELARSSHYARLSRRAEDAVKPHRGPRGVLSDQQLLEHIRQQIAASAFSGEGYRKLWARLRGAGIRTSKRRVLRLMKEHGLLAPVRVGKPRGPVVHDGTITKDEPNKMWGTDITSTVLTTGRQVAVFVSVDHCGVLCNGIHAAERATRWEALEPIRQAVCENFGEVGQAVANGVELRHDHGSQYTSYDFQQEIKFLGISSSPAFVRQPEGNGCAEWFIRVLKENLLWVRSFETVEELRQALLEFKEYYNNHWIMSKYGYKTPAQIHREKNPASKEAA